MAIEYREVTPNLIPNTTMKAGYINGVHRIYVIAPVAGYVLHSSTRDFHDENDNLVRGYGRSSASCGTNYDFENTSVIDGCVAYGSREFFARPENEVLADQIF
jgi:hypothetical protein